MGTDEQGMPVTKKITTVSVCSHQVCHIDEWEALLDGRFPRFSVAKVKYDVTFQEHSAPDHKLNAGERVIVLNDFPISLPINGNPGTKHSLYVRRCGNGSAGLNWDADCFEGV